MADVNVMLKVEGWNEVRKKLRSMRGLFLQEMDATMAEGARIVQQQSNAAAPVASGTLVSSATIQHEKKADFISYGMGYTDEKAAAVHEGIHWGHKFGKKERGFQWLMRVMEEFAPSYIEHVAMRLRRLTGGK